MAKKLLKATLEDDHRKIKKLLEKGADINLPVKGKYNHYTPLGECIISISICSESTIKLLLENGADMNKLNAEKFKAGAHWKPSDIIFTYAITRSIDTGNHQRFTFLTSLYPDIELSSVAHMKLYGCYGTESIGITCGSKNSKWPKDLKKARWHLEKSVQLFDGKTHDGKLNFFSDPRYRLAMDIKYALGTWANQYNDQDAKAAWPIADAVPYCEQAVEWLKPDAERQHKNDCSSPSVFNYCHDGSGKKFGTGSGYLQIRSLLNNCLAYTKDHETWERLLTTRMDYFSLRSDVQGQHSWLLSHAESRYRKNNDVKNGSLFANMRSEAIKDAAILKKNNWDPRRQFYGEKARRWLAAQEQQERDDKIAAQRRWKGLQEWSAQSDREQKKAWANSKSQDDQFWSNIKKTERQTMDNINANRSRMQKSRASSTSSSNGSSSSQDRQQQSQNSQMNNGSNKKEQCPLRPLGKFDPNAPAVSDKEALDYNKADYKKWYGSLSPYCKSQNTKPENLYKGSSGSGVRK
ncbi:hypothetical protein OAG89_03485 [Pseudomonadales bacterium]|nr:hypothetical protein [Pseudomonadales bacterium]